jgi:hypothetical protein
MTRPGHHSHCQMLGQRHVQEQTAPKNRKPPCGGLAKKYYEAVAPSLTRNSVLSFVNGGRKDTLPPYVLRDDHSARFGPCGNTEAALWVVPP